jgi:hypothetical protein
MPSPVLAPPRTLWFGIEQAIRAYQANIVCILCKFSATCAEARHVAAIAKAIGPAAPVMLGDAHATVAWKRALDEKSIDVAVFGEAEDLIVPIATALAEGHVLTGIEAVTFRCGEGKCECSKSVPGFLHVRERSHWDGAHDDLPYPQTTSTDAVGVSGR